MKSLGNINKGSPAMATSISKLAHEHGRIAVFIGETGNVAYVAHYEDGYGEVLETHSSRLVGVYEGSASGCGTGPPSQSIFTIAKGDLEHWMGFIRVPTRVKVARRKAA